MRCNWRRARRFCSATDRDARFLRRLRLGRRVLSVAAAILGLRWALRGAILEGVEARGGEPVVRQSMTKTVQGVVHGRTIQLSDDLGVAEGQQVEVQVRLVQPGRQWGEGIRRSAGGWADYPEMDAIMETIQQDRKLERRPHLENE